MRSISISLLFIAVSIFSFGTVVNAQTGKYVEIKVGYTNVYKQLDPQSDIIKQAKKGDRLEMVYDGTSWYQVKVNNTVGWIEKRSGAIVDSPNTFPLTTVLITLILVGGITGILVYNAKNKTVIV